MSILRSAALSGLVALPLIAGTAAVQPAAAAQRSAAHRTWTVMEKSGANGTFVFAPATLKIKAGDTVVWKDANSIPHNIVGVTAADQKVINRAAIVTASYRVTFKKARAYHYVCQIHPGMKGVVIVSM